MAGAVAEILATMFSGPVGVEEREEAPGSTPAEILGNDPERLAYLIVNTGSVVVRLSWKRGGTAADAVPLDADGGSLSVNVRDDYTLPTHAVLANADAGTGTLRIIVVRRQGS